MQHRPFPSRHRRASIRVPVAVAMVIAAGILATACGGGTPSSTAPTTVHTSSAPGSCADVSGAHHARVVVEPSPGHVVQRCVGFSGANIAAVTLLKKSHIELGTQTYSFGLAICQVDNVPSHYAQCLATGQNYWAVFLSTNGRRWTSPSTGVSDITVPSGGSLGLRYDAPTGTAAAPPKPSPA